MSTLANVSEEFVRHVDVAADHPAFEGHFPGRPLLPGVAVVAEVLEAARTVPGLAARIGASPHIDVVKFLAPVLPGARLVIRFRLLAAALEFRVDDGDHVAASGRLSNGGGPEPSTP
jgi:3-hydroxyacyl-[acyl-carrier-protein] dehydratase